MIRLLDIIKEECRKTDENEYTLYSKYKQSNGRKKKIGTFPSLDACKLRDKMHKRKAKKRKKSKKK